MSDKPLLTFGTAVYDDADGLWFTVQSLKNNHPKLCPLIELVVVDSNPDSVDGESSCNLIKNFSKIFHSVRYEPYKILSTAQPRNRIFEVATGEFVLVSDSHVLYPNKTLEMLYLFLCYLSPQYAPNICEDTELEFKVNANSKSFLKAEDRYGITFHDALIEYFEFSRLDLPDYLQLGDDDAWEDMEYLLDAENLFSGPLLYDGLDDAATHFDDHWGGEMRGQWGRKPDLFETRDHSSGFELNFHREQSMLVSPQEIPAMGLGSFLARRESWLGFNRQMRGFGGEEFYIHEKYRQAGRKCVYLPFLQWNHKFRNPKKPVPYRVDRKDKVRNYLLAHRDLGTPTTEEIEAHFCVSKNDPAVSSPFPIALFLKLKQEILGGEIPDDSKIPGLSDPHPEMATPEIPYRLQQTYFALLNSASDIQHQLPYLESRSTQYKRVVELGTGFGVSSVALLHGLPHEMLCVDKSLDQRTVDNLKIIASPKTELDFMCTDSLEIDIPECDLLFIDTFHSGDQLYQELIKHHSQVTSNIIMHDTFTFGENGEQGTKGLMLGLRRFLREYPEWSVIRHDPASNGMTTISKVKHEKPTLPPFQSMARHFTTSMLKSAKASLQGKHPLVSQEVQDKRLVICSACPLRHGSQCSVCGCYLDKKTVVAAEECPILHWRSETGDASESQNSETASDH